MVMMVKVSNTHMPSSPIINLVCSLSLSLSLDELQSHPNDKVEHVVDVQYQSLRVGVLDPFHRLSSLAHASTCREQASEPAIIDSSMWDIGRAVSARAIWVEFRRAESNNAKLKTRNDSGATALETEQKVSNVIGKSRSETTPPSQQGRRQWVGRINQRKVPNTRTRRRRTKRLRSDSCTHCSLSSLAASCCCCCCCWYNKNIIIIKKTKKKKDQVVTWEKLLSLILSLSSPHTTTYENESEWVRERELLISHELEGRKVCIVLYHVSLSLSQWKRKRRKIQDSQTNNKQRIPYVGGWRLAAAAAVTTTTSSITTTSPTLLDSSRRYSNVKSKHHLKLLLALTNEQEKRSKFTFTSSMLCITSWSPPPRAQHWERREREKNKWNRSNPQ